MEDNIIVRFNLIDMKELEKKLSTFHIDDWIKKINMLHPNELNEPCSSQNILEGMENGGFFSALYLHHVINEITTFSTSWEPIPEAEKDYELFCNSLNDLSPQFTELLRSGIPHLFPAKPGIFGFLPAVNIPIWLRKFPEEQLDGIPDITECWKQALRMIFERSAVFSYPIIISHF